MKKSYPVHAVVTAPIYDAMLRTLESGAHLNLSEYVGDLIEKDIEERGIELEPVEAFGARGVWRYLWRDRISFWYPGIPWLHS